MPAQPSIFQVIHTISRDGSLLFATRAVRMFAYGFLSVVLVLYLRAEGLSEQRIGVLLSMTLLGDMVISLWITTAADRIGRKRMLILGAGLMIMVGAVFAVTANYVVLLAVATIGVLSPSDKEVGPFLSIEQAALAQTIADDHEPPSSPGTTWSARSRRRSVRLPAVSPRHQFLLGRLDRSAAFIGP